jgi:hypothetical protein
MCPQVWVLQAEQAAAMEQGVRLLSQASTSPDFHDPGTAIMCGDDIQDSHVSHLLDPTRIEGGTCSVLAQNVAKSYAAAAKFAGMQELWYTSSERILVNIRDMKVVFETSQGDVPVAATVLNSKVEFHIRYNPDANPAKNKRAYMCVVINRKTALMSKKCMHS